MSDEDTPLVATVGYVQQLSDTPRRKKKHPIGFSAPPVQPPQKKAGDRDGK